ncbi:MAG: hypothetical protein GXY85_01515 [Candidatus Brocadiaceae bacterium]|nr:hypothetical protein [Candidatus Brocadiaceae bacterium]
MSLPISFIVDDPAPLVNVYWWHVAARSADGTAVLKSGEPVVRDVPVDFIRRFADVVERHGLRGKFSVLPVPAALGPITEGWPGCDRRGLQDWLSVARERIAPQFDITPEILTHARAVDLDTMDPLDENERDWASHQTHETLTPYIAKALQILKEAGLEATGVTSPWDFGREVEPDYRIAIRTAMKEVNGRDRAWYFLHTDTRTVEPRSEVVWRDGDAWLVSLWSRCDDYLWNTMETARTDDACVRSVADRFLTDDGAGGRLAELLQAGEPIVFHSHWQSLFSNGRETGLRILDEVGRRIRQAWGDRVTWLKCSDLAARIAAGSPRR